MNYYLDTEFIERFHKPLFGKARHVIDLISIGIVAEDGREYSAISNEYIFDHADDWVKQNVILPLYLRTVSGMARQHVHWNNFHKGFGKSNKQIAAEVYQFVNPDLGWHSAAYNNSELKEGGRLAQHFADHDVTITEDEAYVAQPKFIGYFADYDWVLFCSLYGRMIDLPCGYPMYCCDLKQVFDQKQEALIEQHGDIEAVRLKEYDSYPSLYNEHNALADARWNRDLHRFLKGIIV